MTTKRIEDMNPDETFDAIFGDGFSARADAAEQAERERIDKWSAQPCTEAGVLKAWMMTTCKSGNLAIEMSELSAAGWPRRNPPERITVALDKSFDRLKVYRLWLVDRTPDGDIGAWIYTPNLPESDTPAEIHIFND